MNMSDTSAVSDDEDPFAMANLPPRLTGLPMVVWASERMGARHDVRVKVHMAHGQRIDQTAEQRTIKRRPLQLMEAFQKGF